MNILIAEDEKSIANSLEKNLTEEGFNTKIAVNGEEAISLVKNNNFDMLILDWRMPELTGLEVCKILRGSGFDKPIILLTALSDVEKKVNALNCGADDYITKPFSFEELMARISAVLRRYQKAHNIILFDDFKLDLINHSLVTPTEKIKLPEKEFELLKYFLENKGVIVNKETLCRDVWELPFTPNTNLVEVTVKNLRRKLEEYSEKKYIKTVYGEGYIFLTE